MKDHYLHQPVGQYYQRDHLLDNAHVFSDIDPKARVVNLGCGRADSLKKVWKRGIGLDFNDNLRARWRKSGIRNRCISIDISDRKKIGDLIKHYGRFEWSMSFDWLEHVQPDRMDAVMNNIKRLAPRGIHVVDLVPESAYRGPDGENLHVSAHDADWWTALLKRHFPSVAIGESSNPLMFVWRYEEDLDPVHSFED